MVGKKFLAALAVIALFCSAVDAGYYGSTSSSGAGGFQTSPSTTWSTGSSSTTMRTSSSPSWWSLGGWSSGWSAWPSASSTMSTPSSGTPWTISCWFGSYPTGLWHSSTPSSQSYPNLYPRNGGGWWNPGNYRTPPTTTRGSGHWSTIRRNTWGHFTFPTTKYNRWWWTSTTNPEFTTPEKPNYGGKEGHDYSFSRHRSWTTVAVWAGVGVGVLTAIIAGTVALICYCKASKTKLSRSRVAVYTEPVDTKLSDGKIGSNPGFDGYGPVSPYVDPTPPTYSSIDLRNSLTPPPVAVPMEPTDVKTV